MYQQIEKFLKFRLQTFFWAVVHLFFSSPEPKVNGSDMSLTVVKQTVVFNGCEANKPSSSPLKFSMSSAMVESGWRRALGDELSKPYMKDIFKFVESQYEQVLFFRQNLLPLLNELRRFYSDHLASLHTFSKFFVSGLINHQLNQKKQASNLPNTKNVYSACLYNTASKQKYLPLIIGFFLLIMVFSKILQRNWKHFCVYK